VPPDLADRLRRVLERHCYDGSEIHHVVDREESILNDLAIAGRLIREMAEGGHE
jgi:hypothetical protein